MKLGTIILIYLMTTGQKDVDATIIRDVADMSGIVRALKYAADYLYDYFGDDVLCFSAIQECCNEKYVSFDSVGMKRDLEAKFYGQHLVSDTVFKAIRGHLRDPNPEKALVLSFHGRAGTGKNFVSNILIKNVFKRDKDSHFVHFVLGPSTFTKLEKAGEYIDHIQQLVVSSARACGRSLFIFDDINHIPDGVLDALYPYVTNLAKVDGIDFRRSIFIFLSNTGSDAIYEKTLEHREQGNIREDLKLHNIEHIVTQEVFKSRGGLHGSLLIERELISHFIPFLPLEREHVKSCIRADIAKKKYRLSEQKVDEVADMLQWVPPQRPLFSKSGCKRLHDKVNLVYDDSD